ncbi:MAG: hypothetical protein KA419_15770 [Acidobacteria bacterium]|nr:hypothetical protein [Acidobacteriota bacterium]
MYRTKVLCVVILALSALPMLAADLAMVRDVYHSDHRSTPNLMFEPATQPAPVFSPRETADNYLRVNAQLFRFPADLSTLEFTHSQESLLGHHFYYRQTIDKVPVMGGEIVVSVRFGNNRVYMVYNNIYPQDVPVDKPKTLIGGEQALDVAWNHLRVHGTLLAKPAASLAWLPEGEGFRLVYRAAVATEAPFGYWEHLVDAASGKIVSFRATEIDGRNQGELKDDLFNNYFGPIASRAELTAEYLRKEAARKTAPAPDAVLASGTGKVFDPDPKSTLASETLTDTSAAADFTAAYFTRTLQEITLSGGVYSLTGPWVTIANTESPATAPSTTTDGNWTAVRGNNAFNDVMTYFHIDQNQRYMRSMGFTTIQNNSISADSDGLSGDDNSHYIPSSNQLAFGHGGVDDNEDADVILHEYWHAIQHSINSSWGGADTGAIGEGFGDYWGASYGYTFPNGPTFHPDWAFHWDGHNSFWAGRAMDKTTAQYDPTKSYPAHTTVNGVNGDELWGTPVWQAFRTLRATPNNCPREDMDKITLQSNFGLGASIKMPAMANAMVAACQSLFPSGPHAGVYYAKFVANNILTAPLKANGFALTAEGCSPANSVADPGEVVTFNFTIQNQGATPTTALMATLQTGSGVTNPPAAVSYGAVAAGGSTTRSFQFTVDPALACGDTLTATLNLQDGSTTHPPVSYVITTGVLQTLFTESFDGVTAPTLPAGWTATVTSGTATWATATTAYNTSPNAAFVVDAAVVTDTQLTTPTITITSADNKLTFWHKYAFEGSNWDGGVLEISVNGGAWTDIVTAGGSFAEGGYTATLSSSYSNPLGGRSAWGGDQTTWKKVTVNLPASAVGQPVKFRFRLGCDSSSGDTGWYVDDVKVVGQCSCCSASPAAADPYDFNGDGYTDILWRNGTTGALGDWYVTPAGAAAGALTGTVSDGNWQVFGSGDFNSSGIADLIWRNVSTGDLAIWLMGAGGYDSTVSLGYVDPGWKVLGAADLNANGNADILWRNFNDGYLSVWLMSNTVGVLGSTFAGGISSMEWKAVGSGHFDNDGRADVLWWNATTGVLSIWFEDENGWQGDMSPGTVDTTWKITGIGDVDGNGIDDLLWRNATSGDLSVWFLNNGGTVSGTTFLGGIADLNWKVKGVGFFNNDAYADILWRHATSGDTVVWYLSGTGKIGELFLGTVDPVWVTLNQGNFPGHSELP